MAIGQLTTKVCRGCAVEKTIDAFHVHRAAKDGLCANCKSCVSQIQRAWKAEHPEKYPAYKRRWYQANADKARAYARGRRLVKPRTPRVRAPFTAEHRANLSAAAVGRVVSPETRAKISASNKIVSAELLRRDPQGVAARRLAVANARRGISHGPTSAETRARISAAITGRRLSAEHCEKIRAMKRGLKLSDSHRAKIAAGVTQARSPAKMSTEDRIEKVRVRVRAWRKANPDRARTHHLNRRAIKMLAFVENVDPSVVYSRANGLCGICSKPVVAGDKWHVDHVIPLSKGGRHAYDNVQLAHALCNAKKGARIVVAA